MLPKEALTPFQIGLLIALISTVFYAVSIYR